MSQTTWDIFNILLNSSAFNLSTASIFSKFDIFHDFWIKEVDWLRSQYDDHGVAVNGSGISGFGFLVEEFAKRSKNLPFTNSENGQKMAEAILAALQAGDSDIVQLGRSRSQGDLLWVKQTGLLTEIIGVGEIKASFEAFKGKVGQIGRQERALDFFTRRIRSSTHPFFTKKKIRVSDQLTKHLIVPCGQKRRFVGPYILGDVEITEIEFTYEELAFVAKLVWPYVLPSLTFGESEINRLWTFIDGELNDFIRPRLDEILGGGNLPYWEFGLFVQATGKLPVLEEDRQWVVNLIQRFYWDALEAVLCSKDTFFCVNDQEKKFYDRFRKGNGQDKRIVLYLSVARCLTEKIIEESRKVHKVRTISNMLDLNLLEL